MRVHFGSSDRKSAPGGHTLISQAANLTFESACRLLCWTFTHCHWIITQNTQPWGWYSFTVLRRVEDRVDLGTAVSVQPMSKAAYRSNFREKHKLVHREGSILRPHVPQVCYQKITATCMWAVCPVLQRKTHGYDTHALDYKTEAENTSP